jgi:hypothetical protein
MPLSTDPSRCDHCPVDRGHHCAGQRVPRLCALVNPDDPSYNPAYRTLLEKPVGDTGPTVETRPHVAATFPEVSLAETLRLLGRMKSCPHREARTDCGCAGLARCAQGRGKEGLVNHLDCFGCLRPAV